MRVSAVMEVCVTLRQELHLLLTSEHGHHHRLGVPPVDPGTVEA
jgi:hypothetical protein